MYLLSLEVRALIATYLFACTLLGCGQMQRLRSHTQYPELLRTVTLPVGFEVWFKQSEGKRIALWTHQIDTYGTPLYFAASDPVVIHSTQDTVRIRYAFVNGSGLGPVSPPSVLSRVHGAERPTVTCQRLSQGYALKVRWSDNRKDGSQQLKVLRNSKVEVVLTRSDTQWASSLPNPLDELEVVYEERRFRSAPWPLTCR